MQFDPISNGKTTFLPVKPLPGQTTANNKKMSSFANILSVSLEKVNHLQQEVSEANKRLARGEIEVEDLHQVVLAGEKADVALLLTVQIRNKVLEAYQELMRMQI